MSAVESRAGAPPIQDALAIPETHRFTYDELKAITNDFDILLGKGGPRLFSYRGLRDHLSDKTGNGQMLSWRERIRIAVEAAQGLEYLHKGRSRFWAVKAFPDRCPDSCIDYYTVVVGTPGYIDPEESKNYFGN
ncbi:hypothetical protein OPV22_030861 [Ensete ventricosum]|uniref:Protein kinase domain-containing protein n=1 Tax=Ensete ventricosum TaxID=4639 RepID=A0AAV8PSZ3_ENSVE|nr:hypothetical protein OPV22_030861 [Ensete ventricosum]